MNDMNERKHLLNKLRTVGFALIELNLFLDTHPDCAEALELYNDYRVQHMALSDEYRCKFGPLNFLDNNSCKWEWVNNPWPWEYEEGIC